MSYVAFGYGRNTDTVGSVTVFGFGILRLFPDGIITIVADKVYQELRLCIIELEE